MFVAWDWENDSYAKAVAAGVTPTATLVSAMADAFLGTISAAGYGAVNYSNIDYLTRFFSTAIKTKYPTWVAQWPRSAAYKWPAVAGKSQYPGQHIMWQFGCFTGIPGMGMVDADIYYKEDNDMSYPQFKAYMKQYEDEKAKEPLPTSWDAKGLLAKAVAMGITDGSRPTAPTPRYQTAIMCMKAVEYMKTMIENLHK